MYDGTNHIAEQALNQINLKTGNTKISKHKHSKKRKEEKEANATISGAQSVLVRAGQVNTSDISPQLEGTYHLTNILAYLENLCVEGKPPVSEEDINQHFGIQIRDFKDLKKKLKNHPHVNYQGKLYSFNPNIAINDKNELLDQLAKLRSVKTSEIQGAYKGYEKDLKQLTESGVIGCFNADEDRRGKLYYYFDPELTKLKAPEEFRQLWAEIKIPESSKEREDLIKQSHCKPFEVVAPYPEFDSGRFSNQPKRKKRAATKRVNADLWIEGNT